MAFRYSATIDQRTGPASGGVYAEMLAGASEAISVRSVRVVTLAAAGGEVGLVRSSAIGTGSAAGIATGIAHRTAASVPTTTSRLQAAWSQAPTGYVSAFRAYAYPAATGTTYELWREEDGPLAVEPGQSLLLVNVGSGPSSALRFNVTWEKGPASDK